MSGFQRVKETIILTASYYGFNLRPEVLIMFVEDLSDYDEDSIIQAYKSYRRNPKNLRMPLPAQIIDLLSPKMADDHLAVDAASRVIEAVSKYGWCNPEDALAHIGELGWRAVMYFGGWQYLCENLGKDIQLTTFNAQIREISKSVIAKAKAGIPDGPLEIPYREDNQISGGLKNIRELVKIKSVQDV